MRLAIKTGVVVGGIIAIVFFVFLSVGTSQNLEKVQMPQCKGENLCVTDTVTRIVDGDTIYTTNYKIRLSLTDTAEREQPGFAESSEFTKSMCPVGSTIVIDQDDLQPYDVYERMIAKVYCGNVSVNESLLNSGLAEISVRYCGTSEFSGEEWARQYGC